MIKKTLKIIWDEFVYGGHLLSLGAVSIVLTSAILLNIKITWDFLLIVYLGTQSIYLYNRYKEYKKDFLTNPERTKHIKKYIKYMPLIVFLFSSIAITIIVYFNKMSVLIFGLSMLFLGLLYSLFLKGFTKKIVGFKSFFISLMWALLVVFLSVYYSSPLNLALLLIFIFVYLKLFIHTCFFDIKDIETDKKEGLLTLAVILRKEKLIYLLNFINIFSMFPIILGFSFNLFPKFSLMLLLTIVIVFYYLQKSKDKKIDITYFSQVAISGEKISWSFLILVGKILSCQSCF